MEKIDTFYNTLSRERMAVFQHIAKKSDKCVFDLYVLDILISQSLYIMLHCLELSLRNKIHTKATEFYGTENWIDMVKWSEYQKVQIANAKLKLSKNQNSKPSNIITHLTFGFWADLFGKDYVVFYNNVAKHVLNDSIVKRKQVHSALTSARQLRNRVAHYEIIIKNKCILHKYCNDTIFALELLASELCIYAFEKEKLQGLLSNLDTCEC